MQRSIRFAVLSIVLLVLGLLIGPAGAQEAPSIPQTGPCAPGAGYDAACDVDHDGDVDIFDVQLAAGHWSQSGMWMSDNQHNHLGQTWTGSDNPLEINGSFTASGLAALILNPSAGDGLRIDAPQDDGVYVASAGDRGLSVGSAGLDGVAVGIAGGDGVKVSRAGAVASWVSSTPNNGFEVGGAEGHGLFVGRVGLDGVEVYDAGGNGLLVEEADLNGVDATSTSATHYGGRFANSASDGAGVYAIGGSNAAIDLILGGTAAADDGRIYSEPSLTGSDVLVFSNDETHIHLDEDNNSTSAFVIYNGANASVWSVTESGVVVAAGPSAVQVDAGSQGQRLAYAVTSPQNWIEDFGSGQLRDGQAVVELEAAYAEAINAGEAYHVFLTPLGDCALYVAEKAAASFIVRALSGQPCSIAFDYRIVGLRRGYETVRLEQFVEVSDE